MTGEPPRRLIIVNPASGGGRTRRRCAQIERWVAHNAAGHYVCTERAAHATELVRAFVQQGGREIVAVGGDGTLHEVVNGLLDGDGALLASEPVTLGIVSSGTGSDFARARGIRGSLDEMLTTACEGRAVVCDLGVASCGGRHHAFVNMAAAGMSSDVVERADGALKRLGRSASFLAATLLTLLNPRSRSMRIAMDGAEPVEVELIDLTIANSSHAGGGMKLAPQARIDDGRLDAVLFGRSGRLALIAKVPKLFRGTHVDDPVVRTARASSITVTSSPECGVIVDGELCGSTPVSFHVLPAALRVRT